MDQSSRLFIHKHSRPVTGVFERNAMFRDHSLYRNVYANVLGRTAVPLFPTTTFCKNMSATMITWS